MCVCVGEDDVCWFCVKLGEIVVIIVMVVVVVIIV